MSSRPGTPSPAERLADRGQDVHYPRYVISVAADLAGIHPQTLRAYERVGLVRPARTPGGGRRYSDADLARIARVAELTRLGLPHVGIKMVLDLEDQLRHVQNVQSHRDRDRDRVPSAPPSPPPPAPRRVAVTRLSRRMQP